MKNCFYMLANKAERRVKISDPSTALVRSASLWAHVTESNVEGEAAAPMGSISCLIGNKQWKCLTMMSKTGLVRC